MANQFLIMATQKCFCVAPPKSLQLSHSKLDFSFPSTHPRKDDAAGIVGMMRVGMMWVGMMRVGMMWVGMMRAGWALVGIVFLLCIIVNMINLGAQTSHNCTGKKSKYNNF